MEVMSQVSKWGGNTDIYYVRLFLVSHGIHSFCEEAPGEKGMQENHTPIRKERNLRYSGKL